MNPSRTLKLMLFGALGALLLGALAGPGVAKDRGGHRGVEKRHRHHHHNGMPAGTIQSFDADSGRLTIALLDGGTVSGLVTRQTRIRCEDEHAPDVSRLRRGESEPGDDRGGEGEAGDDRGGHDEEAGDDRGDDGEEVGDDRGGDNSGPGSSNSGPSGHDDNGAGANCTTSDLIEGTGVLEAELEIEHGSASFEEVELAS